MPIPGGGRDTCLYSQTGKSCPSSRELRRNNSHDNHNVDDDDDVGLVQTAQIQLYLSIFVSIASVEHLSSLRKTLVKCAKVRNVPSRIDFKPSVEGAGCIGTSLPQLPLCFMSLACPAVHLATVNSAESRTRPDFSRCQVFMLRAVKQVVVTLIMCPTWALSGIATWNSSSLVRLHYLAGQLGIHLGINKVSLVRKSSPNYSRNLASYFFDGTWFVAGSGRV